MTLLVKILQVATATPASVEGPVFAADFKTIRVTLSFSQDATSPRIIAVVHKPSPCHLEQIIHKTITLSS
jgi:hypothetical protein